MNTDCVECKMGRADGPDLVCEFCRVDLANEHGVMAVGYWHWLKATSRAEWIDVSTAADDVQRLVMLTKDRT